MHTHDLSYSHTMDIISKYGIILSLIVYSLNYIIHTTYCVTTIFSVERFLRRISTPRQNSTIENVVLNSPRGRSVSVSASPIPMHTLRTQSVDSTGVSIDIVLSE